MTKVKENAAIQLSAATSTSFDQINTFAHQYDRGGNLTINGKPSYSVDQAADYTLRDNAAWTDRDGNGTINLTYTFLTAKPAWGLSVRSTHSRKHRPYCLCNPGQTLPRSALPRPLPAATGI
ncbi:hypothetical protein PSE10C_21850 [Pseudomonas amygdali pv. eriobotryae]|uniref:Serralysin n=1 Tax=Pseudomonas amygdali pv. eriobotryae TaxID=129137 RepID=A0A9P3ADC7_PSEA0|nr:hypothetical protein PSE10A_22270 [Pseudomonas amygdali pv. eriobotryae]GFZ71443.1 hypothetical protein PSE10C_21850 [Pseudomonas amygdali pv. eriobotryae]